MPLGAIEPGVKRWGWSSSTLICSRIIQWLKTFINRLWLYKKMPKDEAIKIANQLLEKVRLMDKTSAFPQQLSGGQQQRVAIARALAMKPEIMLFDEPTSALDPELKGEVLQTIRDLTREGITMIVVTHEMEFARQVADRVVYMDEGKVIEEGETETFLCPLKMSGLFSF